jgi:hypothetical protein
MAGQLLELPWPGARWLDPELEALPAEGRRIGPQGLSDRHALTVDSRLPGLPDLTSAPLVPHKRCLDTVPTAETTERLGIDPEGCGCLLVGAVEASDALNPRLLDLLAWHGGFPGKG